MKIFRNVIIIIIGTFLILWGLSFLLSRSYTVERSILVDAPVDNVYDYVSNLKNWKYWNPWLTRDPDTNITYFLNHDGSKAQMQWKSTTTGNGEVHISLNKPEYRILYSLTAEGFETAIHGEFLFRIKNNKTQITWIDNGDLGPSPLSKYYIHVVENTIGSEFEKGLYNLKNIIEKQSL